MKNDKKGFIFIKRSFIFAFNPGFTCLQELRITKLLTKFISQKLYKYYYFRNTINIIHANLHIIFTLSKLIVNSFYSFMGKMYGFVTNFARKRTFARYVILYPHAGAQSRSPKKRTGMRFSLSSSLKRSLASLSSHCTQAAPSCHSMVIK